MRHLAGAQGARVRAGRRRCSTACGRACAGASSAVTGSDGALGPGHRRQRLLRHACWPSRRSPGATRSGSSTSTRPGRRSPRAEFVAGDVRDRAAVRAACEGVDVVFHNVAQVPLAKDRALFDAVNVGGTANVLVARARRARRARSCTRRRARCSASPSTIRSPRTRRAVRSRRTAAPSCAPSSLCHDAIAAGLDVTIVRPRTILGHGRLGVIALLFEFVADGAPVFVLGGGDNRYQLVHADRPRRRVPARGRSRRPVGLQRRRARVRHDARDAAGARRPRADRLARAVAAGRAGAARDAARWRRSVSRRSRRTTGCSTASRCTSTSTKARTELGWEPQHSNASMVIESYEWFLAHRDASRTTRRAIASSVAGPPGLGTRVEGAAVSRSPCKARSYTSGSVDPALEVDPLVGEPVDPTSPSTDRGSRRGPGPAAPGRDVDRVAARRRCSSCSRSRSSSRSSSCGARTGTRCSTWRRPRSASATSRASHPPLIGLAGRIGPFGPERREPPRTAQLLRAVAGLEAVRRLVLRAVRVDRRARHRRDRARALDGAAARRPHAAARGSRPCSRC